MQSAKHKFLYIVLFLGLLSGCKTYKGLPLKTYEQLPDAFVNSSAAQDDSLASNDLAWNDYFKDPHLINLIDTAIASNFDAQIALHRVQVARSFLVASRGALLPTIDAVATAGVDRFGEYTLNGVGNYDTNLSEHIRGNRRIPTPTPEYFLGLRSSWEIDLWGKNRNRKKAAYNRFLASEKGRQFLITSLVSQVASLYYELIALDSELKILRRNIRLQEVALDMVTVQKEGGRATELALLQFKAQLLGTRSLEAEKQQEIVETENALNQLLGRYPRPIQRSKTIFEQELPAQVLAGVPSEMLTRRPDIQQAELELVAAKADVEAARAAFLPSLTISPYAGFNAFNAAVLFDPASLALGVLGGLTGPLFNYNLLKGQYSQSAAGSAEAYYSYQRAIHNGYQEVVTNLKGIENSRKAYELREQEVATLRNAVTTANDLFGTGYASYLEVITAQRSVLEAELQLNTSRKTQFLYLIDLYRSLGGGWKQ
jgi:outer membrane protein, multidrug efflux system